MYRNILFYIYYEISTQRPLCTGVALFRNFTSRAFVSTGRRIILQSATYE
jgi:hypothetical protein